MTWIIGKAGRFRQHLLQARLSFGVYLASQLGKLLKIFLPVYPVDVGNDVLILSNGPSLSKVFPMLQIRQYDSVFAVNYFAATEYFSKAKPSHYLIQDPYWFTPIDKQNQKARDTILSLVEKVSWDMTLIFPSQYIDSESVKRISQNPYVKLAPTNLHRWPSFLAIIYPVSSVHIWTASTKKLVVKSMSRGNLQIVPNGVAQVALFFSVMSGAKKIHLAGIDMTMANTIYLKIDSNSKAEPIFEPKHFYSKSKADDDPLSGSAANTMANNYRSIGEKFDMFYLIADLAELKKIKILNMSRDSLLDCFEFDHSFEADDGKNRVVH